MICSASLEINWSVILQILLNSQIALQIMPLHVQRKETVVL